jgi:glycosyltransferase involved in cell wall biosynthesis
LVVTDEIVTEPQYTQPSSPGATPGIRVSVVIASYNSERTIERCLRSLEQQPDREAFEIIVVDSSQDGTADLIAREFPRVKLFRYSERKFPGDARNIGVCRSTGDIIAFTDADCFVEPGWVHRILEAHEKMRHPVIGGAVVNGNPESYVGWAHYFAEFSQWMPQATSCEMAEIPTTCLTVKRRIFEKSGPFIENTYCSDTAFNWTLGRYGYRPLFLPALWVSHTNIAQLHTLLRRKAFHGTCFARVRATEQSWSRSRRVAYVLVSPALPALLFGRVLVRVIRKKAHVTRFLLASPLVFAVLIAWAWGEFLGYLSPSLHAIARGARVMLPEGRDR